MTERFDIIQVSLIDTWAATGGGRVRAHRELPLHDRGLEAVPGPAPPRGVLTVSRWYFDDRPAEMYRLTALAVAALAQRGVRDPRQHIVDGPRHAPGAGGGSPEGVGTILVSSEPFNAADVDVVEKVAAR